MLAVDDVDNTLRDVQAPEINVGDQASGDQVRTVKIKDPDGNSIAFAQALDRHTAHLGLVDGVLLRLKHLRSLFRVELSLPPQRLSASAAWRFSPPGDGKHPGSCRFVC
jgi:hypothetical protein